MTTPIKPYAGNAYDITQSVADAERIDTALQKMDPVGQDRLKAYLDRGGIEPVLAEMKTGAAFRFDPTLKALTINTKVGDTDLSGVISSALMEANMGFNAKRPIIGGEVKKDVAVKPAMGPKNQFNI